MPKARVDGRNVELLFMAQSLPVPISLGEIDSFSAKSQTTIHKRRPVGFINDSAQLINGGWDLSFETGKVDWSLCHYYWLQEQRLRDNKTVPLFTITETISHYEGGLGGFITGKEQYVYKNVVIYELDLNRSIGDIQERFSAFSTNRTLGPIDNTILVDPIGNAAREAVMRLNSDVFGDFVKNFERPF